MTHINLIMSLLQMIVSPFVCQATPLMLNVDLLKRLNKICMFVVFESREISNLRHMKMDDSKAPMIYIIIIIFIIPNVAPGHGIDQK